MENTPRQRYLKRWAALKSERETWKTHWQDISENCHPRRGRFLTSDVNRGGNRNQSIINSTPRRALRVLAAGMMAGITSPSRPWFRLTTPDPAVAESGAVRSWLHAVEERMRTVFVRSNVYAALHGIYEDLGGPGTAAMVVEEDDEDILRAYNLPIGQYALANSSRGQVDTLFREFSMTVGQLVERFTKEKCSKTVQQMFDRGEVDAWLLVLHAIEPNRNFKSGSAEPTQKRWRSCWMEMGADDRTGFLRESGFDEFPAMTPRWAVNGEDVYGASPAMDALGDAKALQQYERRKAQLVDKIANPPMVGPSSLLHGRASLLPGDITYVDVGAGGQRFEPAQVVNPQAISAIGEEIRRHEQRINEAFFVDLFLMLAQSDRREITAREVAERHEEKMLQLGPVLERLQDELLDPLIDRSFAILVRKGQIPPPPQELQGMELRVEYVSIMAQAQKLLGTAAVERLATFVGAMAQYRPDALDKLNVDEMVDDYAGMLGVKPDLVLPDDKVEALRAERAAQQQAQKQAEAMAMAAKGARDLSGASLENDNALNRMLGGLGAAPVAES